jgi:hypothetical protein
MSDSRIGRRQLVRTAAAVTAGGALAVGAGAGPASAHDGGFQGAWRVTHTDDPPGSPEPGVTVVGLAAGGVVAATDIMPAGPTGTGAWSSEGKRLRLTYWAPLPAEGDEPGGSIRIRAKGRLQHGMLSGTFAVTGFAPDGTEVFAGTGTFTGTRISA